MKRKYEKKGPPDKAGLRELLAKDGRDYLLPLVNVFVLAGGALDQIIDVIGRAAIEAVLDISAADVAGEKQPGRSGRARARRTTGGSGAGCTWRTGPSGSRSPGCAAPARASSRSRRTRRSGGRRDSGSGCLNCCWPA